MILLPSGNIRVCNTKTNVDNWKRNALERYTRQMVFISILRIGAPKGAWDDGLQTPTLEVKFKMYIFCRHYDVIYVI